MKKIALVAYALNIGGMETFLLGLARHLKTKGMAPTFVITDYIGPWHKKPVADGFAVEAILPRIWQSRARHARRVAACLKKFDIVLINHSAAAQSSLGLLPKSVVAIPVLHNDSASIYTVGLANRQNSDLVVAVSERIRLQSIARGISPEQIRCVKYGVEVVKDLQNAARNSSKDTLLRIAFVGRIEHRQKGVLHLPGILHGMTARGIRFHCDIIGGGGDMGELRVQMMAAVPPGAVTFHGPLPHENAMRVLQDADALLMPSNYEGQGIVIFEAMMRGVVPVVSNLRDVTDTVIAHGKNGILVKAGDEYGFADALAQLANDRKLLAKMSRAARQTALEEYGVGAMVQQYLDIFAVCGQKHDNPGFNGRTGTLHYPLLGRWPGIPSGIVNMIVRAKKVLKKLFKI